jgi:hypothetical protein
MAKKCIPTPGGGVFCIENMTLCVLILLIVSVGYLYYIQFKPASPQNGANPTTTTRYVDTGLASQNIYAPPLNTIDVRGPIELSPSIASVPLHSSVPLPVSVPLHSSVPLGVGIPVNIRTSTANTSYRQIGILTKHSRSGGARGDDPLILPLFGRNLLNGRDKWQYYTMSNSSGASFNAKLPISVNGRSCTGEYGCDGIYNGDTVYVEGYEETFRATIYENATLNYIPV